MENRVNYLSDKLVHARQQIKARQEHLINSRAAGAQTREQGENSAPNQEDAAAMTQSAPATTDFTPPDVPTVREGSPAGGKQMALERRHEQTLQLRRDLEQRVIRCLTQTGLHLTEVEQQQTRLSDFLRELETRRAALDALAIPDADEVNMVELGDLYRAIDRERLAFFQLEANIDSAARSAGFQATSATPALSEWNFRQAFRLGLAFSLPLILGLGAVILLGALLLFFSWR